MEARLRVHKRDWEDLGDLDPVWAILSRDAGKHGGWDLDDFFATGEEEIARMLDHAGRLGYPAKNASALDFGCGIGRLSRALATRFDEVLGIDISERMVEQARELNGSFTNCRFIVVDEGPQALPDERFDLIYTRIVLQHLPSREWIADYVVALIGRLKPGGLLVFQLPSHIPARKMIQPRRRAYSLLRALGVKSDFLYRKLGLNPIRMLFMPKSQVVSVIEGADGRLLEAKKDSGSSREPRLESHTYYVTTAEASSGRRGRTPV